jgi:hypothetical protein
VYLISETMLANLRAGDSAVGVVTGAAGPRDQSSSPCKGKIFLSSTSSRTVLGPTQPPIQGVPGAPSPGVKWPEREADHSPPTSAEVKNPWIYTSTPHTSLWRSA